MANVRIVAVASFVVLFTHAAVSRGQVRLVVALRHNINQSDQPFELPADSGFKHFFSVDAGAGGDGGYDWYMAVGPMSELGYKKLPPGVVLGLKHSVYQRKQSIKVAGKDVIDDEEVPDGLMKRFGGDMGAPSGHGYSWFETVNPDFDWDLLKTNAAALPTGTIVSLRHTEHARKSPVRWRIDGKSYEIDPIRDYRIVNELMEKLVFKRNSGGDRGPSKPGQGLFRFGKKVDD